MTPPAPAAARPTAAHRPERPDHAQRTGTATEPPSAPSNPPTRRSPPRPGVGSQRTIRAYSTRRAGCPSPALHASTPDTADRTDSTDVLERAYIRRGCPRSALLPNGDPGGPVDTDLDTLAVPPTGSVATAAGVSRWVSTPITHRRCRLAWSSWLSLPIHAWSCRPGATARRFCDGSQPPNGVGQAGSSGRPAACQVDAGTDGRQLVTKATEDGRLNRCESSRGARRRSLTRSPRPLRKTHRTVQPHQNPSTMPTPRSTHRQAANRRRSPATSRQQPIRNDSKCQGRRRDRSIAPGHGVAMDAFTRQESLVWSQSRPRIPRSSWSCAFQAWRRAV